MLVAAPLSDDWKEFFLATLRATGNISLSAQRAGVIRSVAMDAKRRDPEFRDKWNEAIQCAVDDIEMAGRRLALEGNATMIIFMLKNLRPAVYQEKLQLDIKRLEKESQILGLPIEDVMSELDLILSGGMEDA